MEKIINELTIRRLEIKKFLTYSKMDYEVRQNDLRERIILKKLNEVGNEVLLKHYLEKENNIISNIINQRQFVINLLIYISILSIALFSVFLMWIPFFKILVLVGSILLLSILTIGVITGIYPLISVSDDNKKIHLLRYKELIVKLLEEKGCLNEFALVKAKPTARSLALLYYFLGQTKEYRIDQQIIPRTKVLEKIEEEFGIGWKGINKKYNEAVSLNGDFPITDHLRTDLRFCIDWCKEKGYCKTERLVKERLENIM